MPWTNNAGWYVVAGLFCVIVTLAIRDRVKLPGGFELRGRKEARVILGVLGISLLVWGCVLWVS
jgi:hypothetical protein